jgi:hypothetical protein
MSPQSAPVAVPVDLRVQLTRIIDAFSQSDLQRALAYFAEGASYETLSGVRCRGLAAIERELTPQFRGDYGVMRFHLSRIIVDEQAREAAIGWTCEHQLDQPAPSLPGRLLVNGLRTLFGKRATWEGIDVFRFDERGDITDKQTFAKARVIAVHRA